MLKRITIAAVIAATLGSAAPASAQQGLCASGYINNVTQDSTGLQQWFPGLIAIEVLEDSGTIRNFTTFRSTSLRDDAQARSLLQLAMTAFLAQIRVNVYADCTGFDQVDGTRYTIRWKGLQLIKSDSSQGSDAAAVEINVLREE